jgi:hypothetical protein
MRCMVLMKAGADAEAGVLPSETLLNAMGKFNQALADAGILLGGEGLKPSGHGARVRFTRGIGTAERGPFADPEQLVSGFWLWQVASLDQAIDWVRRCPAVSDGSFEIEIRPMYEAADFGEAFTPQARAREEQLRVELANRVGQR